MNEGPSIVVIGCAPGEPARECHGKFLDVLWRGQQYLVFGAAEAHRYHNQILGAFLAAQGIPHHWVTPERLEVDTPDLVVRGGGRFRLDPQARLLELWDNSQVYGRFDAERLPARIDAPGHAWSGLVLRVS